MTGVQHADVLVAGAGPGGLAAAMRLLGLGRSVTLVESGPIVSTRWNMVNIGDDAWSVIRDLDWERSLLIERDGSLLRRPRALEAIDNTGRWLARERGAGFVGDTGDIAVRTFDDRAEVVADGAVLGAQYVVDATGGRLAGEDSPRRLLHASDVDWYVAGRYEYDPARPRVVGARDLRIEAPDRPVATVTVRATANPVDGSFVVVDAPWNARPSEPGDLLRRLEAANGLPSHLQATRFGVRSAIATTAVEGRVVGIGDAVSRRHPTSRSGIELAVSDGVRAAEYLDQALRSPHDAPGILAAYDAATMARHASVVEDSLRSGGRSGAFRDPRYRAAMQVLVAHDERGRFRWVRDGLQQTADASAPQPIP